MNACDPELKIENLRRLASRNAGREIKLTRKQICKAYEDIQEGNLPLPPLVLSKNRTHMVDKKSPLKLKDYDVLFKSSSKLVALRRIARKIGLTQLDNITKAKLVENIKNRLVSLKIHEPVILVKPRTKKTVTSEFSNNTVSNGNSAYNNTATSGNSMNNMGNSAYNNSGNSGNAMNNSANNTGGNNNSRAMNTNAPVNSTSNAPMGNTNNSRAPARTSAVAFPNKVSITGTPRFLGGGGVKYGGGGGSVAAPAAPVAVGRGMYNQPNVPVIAPQPRPSRPLISNSKEERARKAKLAQAETDLAKLKSERTTILDERKQLHNSGAGGEALQLKNAKILKVEKLIDEKEKEIAELKKPLPKGPGIFGRMFGGGKKKTNAPRTNAPKANTPNVPKKPNAPKTNDPKKPNAPTPPPAPPVPGRPTANNLVKQKKLITVRAHLKTKSKLTNVEKKQFENKVTKNTNVEVLKKEINAANAAKPNTPKTNVPKKPNAPTPPAVPGRPTANNLVKQRKLITVKAHLGTKTKLTNVEKKQFMNKVTKNTNVEVLKKEINAANAAKPNVPNPAAKKAAKVLAITQYAKSKKVFTNDEIKTMFLKNVTVNTNVGARKAIINGQVTKKANEKAARNAKEQESKKKQAKLQTIQNAAGKLQSMNKLKRENRKSFMNRIHRNENKNTVLRNAQKLQNNRTQTGKAVENLKSFIQNDATLNNNEKRVFISKLNTGNNPVAVRASVNAAIAKKKGATQNKLKENATAYMNKPEVKPFMKNVDRQSILNKVNRKERNFTTMNGIQKRVNEYVTAYKNAKKGMELEQLKARATELQLGNRGNSIIKQFSATNSKMPLSVAIKGLEELAKQAGQAQLERNVQTLKNHMSKTALNNTNKKQFENKLRTKGATLNQLLKNVASKNAGIKAQQRAEARVTLNKQLNAVTPKLTNANKNTLLKQYNGGTSSNQVLKNAKIMAETKQAKNVQNMKNTLKTKLNTYPDLTVENKIELVGKVNRSTKNISELLKEAQTIQSERAGKKRSEQREKLSEYLKSRGFDENSETYKLIMNKFNTSTTNLSILTQEVNKFANNATALAEAKKKEEQRQKNRTELNTYAKTKLANTDVKYMLNRFDNGAGTLEAMKKEVNTLEGQRKQEKNNKFVIQYQKYLNKLNLNKNARSELETLFNNDKNRNLNAAKKRADNKVDELKKAKIAANRTIITNYMNEKNVPQNKRTNILSNLNGGTQVESLKKKVNSIVNGIKTQKVSNARKGFVGWMNERNLDAGKQKPFLNKFNNNPNSVNALKTEVAELLAQSAKNKKNQNKKNFNVHLSKLQLNNTNKNNLRTKLNTINLNTAKKLANDRVKMRVAQKKSELLRFLRTLNGLSEKNIDEMMTSFNQNTSNVNAIKNKAANLIKSRKNALRTQELQNVSKYVESKTHLEKANKDGMITKFKNTNVTVQQIKEEANARNKELSNAKNEANRKAQEEANRKAKEEEEKKEANRKAKEEANRKAKEEANRKAKEEANRKAKEEANKKAKEEANRKAKEEANRKKKNAQRQSLSKLLNSSKNLTNQNKIPFLNRLEKGEDLNKIRSDVITKIRSLAKTRQEKEEANRKAKEEANRMAKEEANRKAKEEANRMAKEEANRKAKEEEKKKVDDHRKKLFAKIWKDVKSGRTVKLPGETNGSMGQNRMKWKEKALAAKTIPALDEVEKMLDKFVSDVAKAISAKEKSAKNAIKKNVATRLQGFNKLERSNRQKFMNRINKGNAKNVVIENARKLHTNRVAKEKANLKAKEEANRKAKEEADRKKKNAQQQSLTKLLNSSKNLTNQDKMSFLKRFETGEDLNKIRPDVITKIQSLAKTRKEKEEANKKAKEEANLKAKEEANRKAKEDANRKKRSVQQQSLSKLLNSSTNMTNRNKIPFLKRLEKGENLNKIRPNVITRIQSLAKTRQEAKAKDDENKKAKEEARLKAKKEANNKAKEEANRKAKIVAVQKRVATTLQSMKELERENRKKFMNRLNTTNATTASMNATKILNNAEVLRKQRAKEAANKALQPTREALKSRIVRNIPGKTGQWRRGWEKEVGLATNMKRLKELDRLLTEKKQLEGEIMKANLSMKDRQGHLALVLRYVNDIKKRRDIVKQQIINAKKASNAKKLEAKKKFVKGIQNMTNLERVNRQQFVTRYNKGEDSTKLLSEATALVTKKRENAKRAEAEKLEKEKKAKEAAAAKAKKEKEEAEAKLKKERLDKLKRNTAKQFQSMKGLTRGNRKEFMTRLEKGEDPARVFANSKTRDAQRIKEEKDKAEKARLAQEKKKADAERQAVTREINSALRAGDIGSKNANRLKRDALTNPAKARTALANKKKQVAKVKSDQRRAYLRSAKPTQRTSASVRATSGGKSRKSAGRRRR